MLGCTATVICVSYTTSFLFTNRIVSTKYDVLKCFGKDKKNDKIIALRSTKKTDHDDEHRYDTQITVAVQPNIENVLKGKSCPSLSSYHGYRKIGWKYSTGSPPNTRKVVPTINPLNAPYVFANFTHNAQVRIGIWVFPTLSLI
jgi:hypothetical protein